MIRISRADAKWLIGDGAPNFAYYRTTGRVHVVRNGIIRWRGMGGTYTRPNFTVLSYCGRQERMDDIAAYQHNDRIQYVFGAFGTCKACLKKVQKELDNQDATT